jgi:hypothetical protein
LGDHWVEADYDCSVYMNQASLHSYVAKGQQHGVEKPIVPIVLYRIIAQIETADCAVCS